MNEVRTVALKTAAYSVIPATILFVVPALILRRTGGLHAPTVAWSLAAGAILAVLGVSLDLWSIWGFVNIGRGTPAPMAPPRILVIDGPFRYVRNPMYIGFAVVILGEALAFRSWPLAGYALALLAGAHLIAVLYEERVLTRTFGEAYREYCAAVPRWVPRLGAMKSMR